VDEHFATAVSFLPSLSKWMPVQLQVSSYELHQMRR